MDWDDSDPDDIRGIPWEMLSAGERSDRAHRSIEADAAKHVQVPPIGAPLKPEWRDYWEAKLAPCDQARHDITDDELLAEWLRREANRERGNADAA